jgi:hypothetical protein
VNKEYPGSPKNSTICVEMDEMGSFYHDKRHHIWLWWAIDHETGAGKSVLVLNEGA